MNVWKYVWSKIRQFGPLIGIAIGRLLKDGLNDDLLRLALVWVRVAAKKEISKAERREWVVAILVARGVKESLARWAVETAYQLYKAELEGK